MMKKVLPPHFPARLLVLLAGLFCIAFGVALSTKSGLGVSPSASLPYLLSSIFPVSMGTFTTLINVGFIFVQIALLRRSYNPVQLLQLAVVLLFGFFTDFTIGLVAPLEVNHYLVRLALCLASCAVMGFGLYLEVKAGLIVMASEGAISAVAQVTGRDFGKVKIAVDCGFVVAGTALSLLYFHTLLGIREGTILAAILVGLFVQQYNKRLHFLAPLLGEEIARPVHPAAPETPLIITIERELGSGGHELGQRLADALGIPFYDYALIEKAAEATGFAIEDVRQSEERMGTGLLHSLYQNSYATSQKSSRQDQIFAAQSQVIRAYAAAGSCVIVGRLGSYVLRGRKNCFHIFVTASEAFRAQRIQAEDGSTPEEALQRLHREDAFRRNYCQHFTGEPWGMAHHYALTLDTSVYQVDGALALVLAALQQQAAAQG